MVLANLNSPVTLQLAETVRKECNGIPKAGDVKELSQADVETRWRRDRADSAQCADAGLSYVQHIEGRDRKLAGKRK